KKQRIEALKGPKFDNLDDCQHVLSKFVHKTRILNRAQNPQCRFGKSKGLRDNTKKIASEGFSPEKTISPTLVAKNRILVKKVRFDSGLVPVASTVKASIRIFDKTLQIFFVRNNLFLSDAFLILMLSVVNIELKRRVGEKIWDFFLKLTNSGACLRPREPAESRFSRPLQAVECLKAGTGVTD
nr:hypothetical protein [Calditrichia bacterium]